MYLYSFISFSSNASYAISKFNELYSNINIYAGLKNLSDSESNSKEYNPTSLLKKCYENDITKLPRQDMNLKQLS